MGHVGIDLQVTGKYFLASWEVISYMLGINLKYAGKWLISKYFTWQVISDMLWSDLCLARKWVKYVVSDHKHIGKWHPVRWEVISNILWHITIYLDSNLKKAWSVLKHVGEVISNMLESNLKHTRKIFQPVWKVTPNIMEIDIKHAVKWFQTYWKWSQTNCIWSQRCCKVISNMLGSNLKHVGK